MAEEATIQGVVSELQVINQLIHDTTDLHLEGLIAIESAAKAIDLKVGRMLEQPAIQETLEKFSQDIVEGINGSFDAALEYQKQRDKEQDREEKGEVEGGEKKGKKSFGERVKSSFKSGMDNGPMGGKALSGIVRNVLGLVETLGEISMTFLAAKQVLGNKETFLKPFKALGAFMSNLGSRIFIFLSGFQSFGEIFTSLGKSLSRLAIPLTLVIGTIGGIIEAFNYFNEAGDGIQSKFAAALEGFVSGFLGTLLAPLDWIIHGIGDFFGIEWMQKLQIVEEMKYAVEIFFNFFEDLGQSLMETYDRLAASPVGQSFKQLWEDIIGAIDSMMETLKDGYNFIAEYVPGLPMIGEDTREKGKTSEDYKMDRKEQREGVKAARNSGLYDANLYGDSTIDRNKVKEAPTNQLIAIVKDDDLSPEDEKFVLEEIASREKRKAAFDTKMGKTVEAPATPEVVNNTTNTSSVLQEVTVPTREKKEGTIPSAMSRVEKPRQSAGEKPNKYVTVDPVTGKYRAFAPNLAATGGQAYALFDTVKEANAFTQSVDPEHEKMMAAELAAFDEEFGLTAPETDTAGRISGAQGAAAQSGELQARQTDLSNAKAANTAAESSVAVVDNSQQQSIVQNNVTSGVNPSPFDKSDRTHRRGAYRGT